MQKCIGIDFGSSKIRAFSSIANIYFEEPAVTAVEKCSKKLLCFGEDAIQLNSRIPGSVELRWLMKESPIPQTNYMIALMKHILENIYGKHRAKPDIAVTRSGVCGEKEESMFADAAEAAGVHDIYIVDSLIAAAYSSGARTKASAITVNMGAVRTEIGLFNRGKLHREFVSSIAGDAYDNALSDYLYKNQGIVVSQQEAEKIKIERGTLIPTSDAKPFEIIGIDKNSGLPVSRKLYPSEFPAIFEAVTNKLTDSIIKMINSAPSEPDKLILTGGMANLPGLSEVIGEAITIPVVVSDTPSDAVILGMEIMNENDMLM